MQKVLLVDFDGVMSNGKFYDNQDMVLARNIQEYLFSPLRGELVKDWMRGKYTYEEINQSISDALGLNANKLNDLLEQSVKEFHLNQPLLRYVAKLRKEKWLVYLYTDNMDIFDRVTVPHFNLNECFDAIYSSSTYGSIKFEDLSLFTRLKSEQNIGNGRFYLVDDKIPTIVKELGIEPFHYKDWSLQGEFEYWLGLKAV